MDAEKLLEDVTAGVREAFSQAEDRARRIVGEAEERARKLVADAEADAKRIRERAEAEADQRLAKVREALSGLEGALGGGAPAGEVEPPPAPTPEPMPPAIPEPTPPTEPEPQPPAEPEPLPPSPEIVPPAPPQPDREPPAAAPLNGGAEKGDEIGARIVATKMALDGASRDEIAAHLAEHYEVGDSGKLLDFVMARAKR
jgi:outer membrane biosynthesis protein TonB